MRKKYFSLLIVLVFVLTFPLLPGASSLNLEDDSSKEAKDLDVLESIQYFPQPEAVATDTVITIDVKGVDEETGKIIDAEKYKESLLKFYRTDPEKFSEGIKNIDSIVEQELYNQEHEDFSQNVHSRSNIKPSMGITIGWKTEPYLTSTQNRVKYKTVWITEDNYRSYVPIYVSYVEELTIKKSIGFEGAASIKGFKGFSGMYEESQTARSEIGAEIPGWTIWGTRPFIRYVLENWRGIAYIQVDFGGQTEVIEREVTGERHRLRSKSNEYWSQYNANQDVNASSPRPPTGKPK